MLIPVVIGQNKFAIAEWAAALASAIASDSRKHLLFGHLTKPRGERRRLDKMTAGFCGIMVGRASGDMRVVCDHSNDWPALTGHLHKPIERCGHGISEFVLKLPYRCESRLHRQSFVGKAIPKEQHASSRKISFCFDLFVAVG